MPIRMSSGPVEIDVQSKVLVTRSAAMTTATSAARPMEAEAQAARSTTVLIGVYPVRRFRSI